MTAAAPMPIEMSPAPHASGTIQARRAAPGAAAAWEGALMP